MSPQKFGKGQFGDGPFVKAKQWTKQTDTVADNWNKKGSNGGSNG